jgi:hypothetical protein
LPQNKGNSRLKEKFKNQYIWQNSSRSSATIHVAIVEPIIVMKLRILHRTQRFPAILICSVLILLPIYGERIIDSFDIARWYLDANLVVISTLIERKTTHVRSIDTASTDGYSFKCDVLKDKYLVVIDSILKGCSNQDTIAIITPEYSINCCKYKITENAGIMVSATGDTTIMSSVEMIPDNYDSGNYFRLGTETKNIIFLKYDRNGYETIYVMHGVNDEDLQFLNEVEMKGEKYFDIFKTE